MLRRAKEAECGSEHISVFSYRSEAAYLCGMEDMCHPLEIYLFVKRPHSSAPSFQQHINIVAIHYQSKHQDGGRRIRALQYPSMGSSQNSKTRESAHFSHHWHLLLLAKIDIALGIVDWGGPAHNLFGKWNICVTRYSTPTSVSCLGCDRVMSVCIGRSSTFSSARDRPRAGDVDTCLLTTSSSALLPAAILSWLLSLKRELRSKSSNLMMIQTGTW